MKKRNFVIIGLDRFGYNLAIHLEKCGHEVVGIDEDQEKVDRVADLITHAAVGDPTDKDVLQALDVTQADMAIVALTEDIQSGVLVTMILKEMGMKNVIAESTSELHGRILQKVGADRVIFPEKDMGIRLAKSLGHNSIMDYIDLSDEYSIIEMCVPEEWAGKTLTELHLRTRYNINVIAFRAQNGELSINPDPAVPLDKDSHMVVIGHNMTIDKLVKD